MNWFSFLKFTLLPQGKLIDLAPLERTTHPFLGFLQNTLFTFCVKCNKLPPIHREGCLTAGEPPEILLAVKK